MFDSSDCDTIRNMWGVSVASVLKRTRSSYVKRGYWYIIVGLVLKGKEKKER